MLANLPPAEPVLFVEFRFAWIFAIIFLVNWALRTNTARKVWLLVCSHVFYTSFFVGNPIEFVQNITAGRWDQLHEGWWFPLLLWFSTFMDYFVGIGIEAAKTQRGRKAWVAASLIVNLGVLSFFKYYGFFDENVRAVFLWLGIYPSWEPLKVFLPWGISFYTFQSLSYSIEVYRKQLPAERNFLNLALFIAFFPQVIAGPIVRAMSYLPQTYKKTVWANVDVRGCLVLFFIGFIKKACISDNLAGVVDAYYAAPQDYNTFSAWMAAICYATQVYCDFSGYSDMAIAVSRLLGYELCLNFYFPFFSASITDFWRRWHMSLSSWLRDYVYISFGGNRGVTKWFTYRNLMITMVLGGLWHGASWAFVLFGFLQGFGLIVHREWARVAGQSALAVMKWVAVPLTFLYFVVTLVPFRAGDTYQGVLKREGGKSFLVPLPTDGSKPMHDGKPVEVAALRMVGGGFTAEGKDPDEAVSLGELKRNPLTGNWHLRPPDGSGAPDKVAAQPMVAQRLSGSWGTMSTVLQGMVGIEHAKRSVVGNKIVIVLLILGIMHFLNYKKVFSTWWRRIPDWSFAMLLGVAVAVAIFMKPVVFKAFIYFQF